MSGLRAGGERALRKGPGFWAGDGPGASRGRQWQRKRWCAVVVVWIAIVVGNSRQGR